MNSKRLKIMLVFVLVLALCFSMLLVACDSKGKDRDDDEEEEEVKNILDGKDKKDPATLVYFIDQIIKSGNCTAEMTGNNGEGSGYKVTKDRTYLYQITEDPTKHYAQYQVEGNKLVGYTKIGNEEWVKEVEEDKSIYDGFIEEFMTYYIMPLNFSNFVYDKEDVSFSGTFPNGIEGIANFTENGIAVSILFDDTNVFEYDAIVISDVGNTSVKKITKYTEEGGNSDNGNENIGGGGESNQSVYEEVRRLLGDAMKGENFSIDSTAHGGDIAIRSDHNVVYAASHGLYQQIQVTNGKTYQFEKNSPNEPWRQVALDYPSIYQDTREGLNYIITTIRDCDILKEDKMSLEGKLPDGARCNIRLEGNGIVFDSESNEYTSCRIYDIGITRVDSIDVSNLPPLLNGDEAMANFQKDFGDAALHNTASATDRIKIGGLDINLGGVFQFKVDNLDITMCRNYSNNTLNLKVTIFNLRGSIPKGLDTFKNFIPGNSNQPLNLDSTVISNLSKVKIDIDMSVNSNMVATIHNFVITGLDEVRDANGVQLNALVDGNGVPLGHTYMPSEMNGVTIDPRHEADPSQAGDQDGIFAAMDKDSNNYTGGTAGATLETFVKGNYKNLSIYQFGRVNVESNDSVTFVGASNTDAMYVVAQNIVNEFLDNVLNPAVQVKDSSGNVTNTLTNAQDILMYIFGTTQVENAMNQLVDMNNVSMTAICGQNGDKTVIRRMVTQQTIALHIPSTIITKIVSVNNNVPPSIINILSQVFANGVNTNINIDVDTTYNY